MSRWICMVAGGFGLIACSGTADHEQTAAQNDALTGEPISLSAPPSNAEWEERKCEQLSFQVALVDGAPANNTIVGWLCAHGEPRGRTLQLLVHGATYNHLYWDFPYQPERYSYVDSALEAGYVTLAIDRIGNGASDHPPAAEVTSAANAFTIHQIIQMLRSGAVESKLLHNAPVSKIITVGHSLGSGIIVYEAGTYHDVDGVIASGYAHGVGPGLFALEGIVYPANLDPHFAGRNIPDGYLTTLPGTRGIFYNPNTPDPNVLAADEANKETLSPGEFDLLVLNASPTSIDVPVLEVIGDDDPFFCAAPSCSAGGTLAVESTFFPNAASLKIVDWPNNGHDLNLISNSAPYWFNVADVWANLNVGYH